MKLFPKSAFEKIRIVSKIFYWSQENVEIQIVQNFPSRYLNRKIKLEIYLPPKHYQEKNKLYPVLFFNDGQDMEAIKMGDTLESLYKSESIRKIIVVGIHAGNRLKEYGTAHRPDYQNRGNKAAAYTNFVMNELAPFLFVRYHCSTAAEHMGFAGFSLGALSAFDIVWNHSESFKIVGVFSGSLWWRSKAFMPQNPDGNRIVHNMVSNSAKKQGLKFWFEAGTEDETEDRNNNGIIDAIDDTLHLIDELQKIGYKRDTDIKYVQVEGGEHNPKTWAKVLPDFLQWAYGRQENR